MSILIDHLENLRSLIITPFLLNANCPSFSGQVLDQAWLDSMIHRSKDLLSGSSKCNEILASEFCDHQPQKLGRYAERLFSFWLRNLPNIEILAENLVVSDGKRTLGEIDFIYRDLTVDRIMHVEFATKFYLYFPSDTHTPKDFIGPNGKDRLDIKVDRLFHHQLGLPASAAGRKAITFCNPEEIKSYAHVKGRIFYPLDQWLNASCKVLPRPFEISERVPGGFWIHQRALSSPLLAKLNVNRWLILPRLFWLRGDLKLPIGQGFLGGRELEVVVQQKLKSESEAVMIAGFLGEREVVRGFIVENSWPQTLIF